MSNEQEKFSTKKRIKSFSFAFDGLKFLLKHEHNTRIHFVATLLVIILGAYLKLHYFEWLIVILCIAAVWVVEIINSAIEQCCDLYSRAYHPKIKTIKDLAAAAVLITALTALIIGLIIFIPKLIKLFTN